MVQSQNTSVNFGTKANLLGMGLGPKNGDILIGNYAFEFYNSRNPMDYLQIPWGEIVQVRAQIYFRNRYIRGFYIDTKGHGSFNFVVKNAGKALKEMRTYLENDQIVRNKTLFS